MYRHFKISQESIPVGCVPPAWKSYVLRWPRDVSPGGLGGGPMNEFEQVSVQSIMGNSGQDDRQTDMTENITFS